MRGDTLWAITEVRYGRVDAALVRAVAVYNGIADPNNIPVGFVLLLPDEAVLYGDATPSESAAGGTRGEQPAGGGRGRHPDTVHHRATDDGAIATSAATGVD